MKKIITLVMVFLLTLLITSCGPNSDYYNLGSKTYYYYVNEPFVLDPYEFFREHNSWIGISNPIIIRNPQNFYDVIVEYRKQNAKESYQKLELDNDQFIKFANPNNELGNDTTYEFKIHFIDKETKDEKEMINYYGVFTFKRSPAYLEKKTINVKLNDTYNLLENIVEYEGENKLTPNKLKAKYDITYKVLLGDKEIKVTDDKVTFDSVGTYKVTITLESTTSSSGADAVSDATSGATPGAGDGGETILLVLTYDIIVTE